MLLKSYFTQGNHEDPWAHINWTNYLITPSLCYAHRITDYTKENYAYGLHYHDYYELNIIVAGDIRFICDGVTFLPKHGDIVMIPPHTTHESLLSAKSTHYIRYKFYFQPDMLDDIGFSSLVHVLTQHQEEGFLFSLNSEDIESLFSYLDEMDDFLTQKKSVINDACILSALLKVLCIMAKMQPKDVHNDEYLPKKLVEIREYIDKHFIDLSSISQLADHFFYSQEYIARLFRKYLNVTVTEYITKKRVSYSQKLIRDTNLPITQICFMAGFGSIPNFIRAFKLETGIVPSAYRAQRLCVPIELSTSKQLDESPILRFSDAK